MKVTYDKDADAAYIRLSDLEPAGVIEIREGINIDVAEDDRIVGIEFLHASKLLPITTLYSYELQGELPQTPRSTEEVGGNQKNY